ncbi:hypothetical protein BRADI_4g42393v3 [Brachypodium distachyon]|uniref:Uncharacterized protein n=1 Tax=Brachypodium distachyon TaxID=15368 RepID=A0A2K2CTT4_BRADI|nr:hypothetical protein BRADI_4g42393v3 [Brachypodium distachyon]
MTADTRSLWTETCCTVHVEASSPLNVLLGSVVCLGQQQAAACTSCDWSLWSPSRRREDCAQGVQEPGERKETSLTKELEEQNRKESKRYYGKVY